MSKLNTLLERVAQSGAKTVEAVTGIKSDIEKNGWRQSASRYGDQATKLWGRLAQGTTEQLNGLYRSARYSKSKLKKLENNIENQGAAYRELLRERRTLDTVFLGGESMATLLAAGAVSPEIEAAYAAAYPGLAGQVGFLEHARTLDEGSLVGLVSGVKGKLFEMRYVEYLNSGVLPDGYTAELATSANEPGWDIAVYGPNQEVSQLLQAKATDSVSYVVTAIERYPSIDVVTTDEVYGHLVMTGVSNNIAASGIMNSDLTGYVESAVYSQNIEFDFMPPVITLAFIAFTSYKGDSLTLYAKAKSAGDRAAKSYLCYIVGTSIAAVTNTWWLGVLGSVSSRYLSDEILKKTRLIDVLERTMEANQRIIDRIKVAPMLA